MMACGRRRGVLLTTIGLALLPLLADGQTAPGRNAEPVAVVELQSSSKRLKPEDVQYLTDMLRTAARSGLDRMRFQVMTRESMEVIVPSSEMKCMAESCLIEIGKRLQAKFVVGGSVKDVGTGVGITLEAYDTKDKMLVGSANERAKDADDAVTVMGLMAAGLIRQIVGAAGAGGGGRGGAPQPPVQEGRLGGAAGEDWNPELVVGVVVSFTSEPAKALVEVDGEVVCETPCSKTFARGDHRVEMKKARYATATQSVTLDKARTIAATLSPNFGWLSVQSQPAGLQVEVGGKSWGPSPIEEREVDPGVYDVWVKDPRYYDEGEKITIKAGERRPVSIAPKPKLGAVKVEAVDDRGNALVADVMVDGARVGKTPWTGRVQVGPHTVNVSSEFGTADQDADVKEKQVASVIMRLVTSGSLGVTSQPSGAAISLDGTATGLRTPATVPALGSGSHSVALTLDGFEEGRADATVRPGATASVSVRLKAVARTGRIETGPAPSSAPAPTPAGQVRAGGYSLQSYESQASPATLEKLRQISTLRQSQMDKLLQLLKNPYYENKAEVYFRLAESYWEEALYQYLQKRDAFDREMGEFRAGTRSRRPVEPVEDYATSMEYYRKVLREFPNYARIDEVLYYLGKGGLKEGKSKGDRNLQKEGVDYLNRLVQNYPKSRFIADAHLGMGDYYFENNSLYYAKVNYEKIINNFPKANSCNYARYKLAWVFFNLQEFDGATATLRALLGALQGAGTEAFRDQVAADLREMENARSGR